jgi:hypothetical protein
MVKAIKTEKMAKTIRMKLVIKMKEIYTIKRMQMKMRRPKEVLGTTKTLMNTQVAQGQSMLMITHYIRIWSPTTMKTMKVNIAKANQVQMEKAKVKVKAITVVAMIVLTTLRKMKRRAKAILTVRAVQTTSTVRKVMARVATERTITTQVAKGLMRITDAGL